MLFMRSFHAKGTVFTLMLNTQTDKTHVYHMDDFDKPVMTYDSACNAFKGDGKKGSKRVGHLRLDYDENRRIFWMYETEINGQKITKEVRGSSEPYKCEAELATALIEAGVVEFEEDHGC